jgi:hypothetical protein
MMWRHRWLTGGLAAVALLGTLGCGPSGPDVELGTVKGTVTLDGAKVTGGRVLFFNVSGYSAEAPISPEGTYEAQTAVGETSVFINHREPDIMPPGGRTGMPMPGKNLVPDKYSHSDTSGLKLTVQSGTNEYDVVMTN